jgi:PII-like signaling protein
MSEHWLVSVLVLGDEKVGALHSVPDVIVDRVRELGLAGATVLRGVDPADTRGIMATTLHPHRPTIVEIVDEAQTLERVLPELLAGVPDTVLVLRERVEAERGAPA